MSTRRRHHDDDDDYRRRNHGSRGSHSKGMGAGAWLLIGLAFFVWAKSGTGLPGGIVHHSPSHGSTVCTQYFKGGC